ncbi:hypothetical protein TNIN_72371 [Trichonephila inaurata madagascariensis]|uniref:Uncharacterized protein n=1 Tax=Trichonephila inaurata madagascariensis TaxID=2747483 RepID=A0A8X7BPS5_9ARAC|nr:hypothetical protein TNIN_72371 [Trichonephila inaurata madagascariensis]
MPSNILKFLRYSFIASITHIFPPRIFIFFPILNHRIPTAQMMIRPSSNPITVDQALDVFIAHISNLVHQRTFFLRYRGKRKCVLSDPERNEDAIPYQ